MPSLAYRVPPEQTEPLSGAPTSHEARPAIQSPSFPARCLPYSLTSLDLHSKFPDNPEATRAFQKVSVAYDILSKPNSKRLYDSRSQQAPFDFFASRSFPQAEETFRSVVIGVFNDLLDGDLEMVRTLLCELNSTKNSRPRSLISVHPGAVNSMNPSLQLGEEGINSVLMTLQAIRTRALSMSLPTPRRHLPC